MVASHLEEREQSREDVVLMWGLRFYWRLLGKATRIKLEKREGVAQVFEGWLSKAELAASAKAL